MILKRRKWFSDPLDVPPYTKDMFMRVNNSPVRSLGNAEVNFRSPLLITVGGINASRTEAPNFGTVFFSL